MRCAAIVLRRPAVGQPHMESFSPECQLSIHDFASGIRSGMGSLLKECASIAKGRACSRPSDPQIRLLERQQSPETPTLSIELLGEFSKPVSVMREDDHLPAIEL